MGTFHLWLVPVSETSFTYVMLLFCRLDQMFSDAFSHEHQLLKADPKHSLYLACALMVRGNVQISDIRRNIERYIVCSVSVIIDRVRSTREGKVLTGVCDFI